MKIFLRVVAVLLVAIGVFLIGAVINALGSAGGARAGIAVLYIAIAIVAFFGAFRLWGVRRR